MPEDAHDQPDGAPSQNSRQGPQQDWQGARQDRQGARQDRQGPQQDRQGAPQDRQGPQLHPEDAMPREELDAHARASATLRRIAAGADPAREAFDLANEFTDETVSRVRSTIVRWFRRR